MSAGLKQKLAATQSPSGHKWRFRPPLTGPAVARKEKTPLCGEQGEYDVPTSGGGRYVVRWASFCRTVEYEPPE